MEGFSPIVDMAGGPFLDRSIGINENAPLCSVVRPPKQFTPSPLRRGIKNYADVDIHRARRHEVPMRALIWGANMGFGNSLQGFVCTLIVSMLSGRQMIASSGGDEGALVDSLFLGFEFPADTMGKVVPGVRTISKGHMELTDSRPVVQSRPIRFCDDAWYSPEKHKCVFQAFNCQDEWCVHSRSVNFMLGRPRLALGGAVMRMLEVAPATSVASLENQNLVLGDAISASQKKEGSGASRVTPRKALAILSKQKHPERGTAAARNLDEEAPTLGGKQAVEEPLMTLDAAPTSPEEALDIEFDISIHVRTFYKCTETRAQDVPGCQENGLKGAMDAAENVERLRKVLTVKKWGCLTQLLAFMFELKASRQHEQERTYKGLFRNHEDEEELREFAHEKHRRQAKRPTGMKSDPLGVNGLWTVKDAQAMGQLARANAARDLNHGRSLGRKGELKIFLATDSAVLRPLLIEYLKPFGSVAYSKMKPVHLSYYKYDDLDTKLGNLGEFYLMGRAAAVFSFHVFWLGKSSFARAAALYGNSSLIYGDYRNMCKFGLEHVAKAREMWHK